MFGAITSALTATISILLFVGVDPMLVGAINAALIAWVGVAVAIVRSKVTPTSKVALTTEELAALQKPAQP